VDNHAIVRKGIRALLEQVEHIEVVGEASDGQEAVAQAESLHPDVILMDVQMPVMDGLEATRRIKSQWPEVKAVALTMHANYRSQALAAGADAFLLKGCTAEELQAAIVATV